MPQSISTVTNIANNGNYTSGWQNSETYSTITGTAFADQALTLFVEQSGDATNVDWSATYPVSASTATKFSEALILPFFRIRVTNTSGNATTNVRIFSHYIRGENA